MKKRFACALLALVLLVSLVPVTTMAADQKISEAAITVLKQLTTFKKECYYVAGSEYRVGYGTVCQEKHHFDSYGVPKASENKHTITEKKADAALRTYLAELDKKVNSFASDNKLSLTQSQHDALVVFSHGYGTSWMSGTGALKTAIVSKAGVNEMLNVMKSLNDKQYNRHQVEVNMYCNGKYSNTIPSNFAKVTYDANGGKIAQGNGETYTMSFDASASADHISATNGSNKLLGWYTDPTGGEWMPKLNADCAGKTLYAHWQVAGNTGEDAKYTLSVKKLASTTVYIAAEVKPTELKDANGKTVKVSGDVEITKDCLDANGTRWGYVDSVGGWVKITTPKADAVAGSVIATATVSYNGYLNVRDSAGTDGKIVGALAKSATVDIYEIKTVNGHRWGKCDKGWICLTYTTLKEVSGKTITDTGASAYAFTGSVNADVTVYTAPGDASAKVAHKDAQGNIYDYVPKDTNITISSLSVGSYGAQKATWAKITWKNPEKDKNGKATTAVRSGWIAIAMTGDAVGDDNGFHVNLDPVMYTVVSDTTNVRKNAGDGAELAFTLSKGVEVEVSKVRLVGENIWGKMTVKKAIASDNVGNKTGWINLASKYVKRTNEIKIEEDTKDSDDHDTGLIATVINTDTVKVRKTGALYGAVIGSLNRGTTVRVWEAKKDKSWYKLDTNQNGTYDYNGDGWVSAKYLEVKEGTVGGNKTTTDSKGNTVTTDGTGTGVVANTYSGVNVRQGAGTGYAAVGKLLPGTTVQILELANGGKWGRTDKGWVCMDYITMVSYNPASSTTTADPSKGTAVDDLDKVDKTTTTAVYTGKIVNTDGVTVFKEPINYDPSEVDAIAENTVRTLSNGAAVTIHELAEVTRTIKSDEDSFGGDKTYTTITSVTYWARTNDGWIIDPESNIQLTALDEKVHTLTGTDTLKVRKSGSQNAEVIDALKKGDQVSVTALNIEKDKVWGRIETDEGTGWIRLDYMSEGKYYVEEKKPEASTPTTPSTPSIGNTGNTGTGGFTTTGYKYKGKVINANTVNVRASASTSASVTTQLKNGAALVIYETTIAENMAWGRCDAGWIYLYYVDLDPAGNNGAVDARVVYNDNTVVYTDVNKTATAGTYARMSVVDIYEQVGKMVRTDLGWVSTDDLL